jgi:tetratricopeptide (TPR) repeat protein
MPLRPAFLLLLGVIALLAAGGCIPPERATTTAEVDDAGFRRGKELVRLGRNQEALSAFLKVIERRGEDAAESHLEAGLLYQQHIKDPVAAIYHFRRFRELKPNAPQAELVRQRIDAAIREFASTLPGEPLSQGIDPRFDTYEVVERLRRENETLKADLAALRAQTLTRTEPGGSAGRSATTVSVVPERSPLPPGIEPAARSPLTPVADGTLEPRSPGGTAAAASPAPPAARPGSPASPTRPLDPTLARTGRVHVVVKGDTLFSLAQRYYGDRSRFRDIYAANSQIMTSPNDLRIGMELRIP